MAGANRQRRRIALIIGAVAIMLALAVVSVEAWRQSDIQRAKADRQSSVRIHGLLTGKLRDVAVTSKR